MSRSASLYIVLISAAGAGSLGYGLLHWHSEDWARYIFYFAIALIASRMKVTLPSVTGTLSMSFLFVLIGISELSLGETLAMGCASMLVQCVLNTRQKPRPVQVLFSVASMACSILVSYWAYHSALRLTAALEQPILLLLAAGVFFITNTFSVALVIGLTESKNAARVWRESYLWSFPNYLVGAAIAWGISIASRRLGWQTALLLLPVLYVIYRSHTLYVNRLEEEKRRAEEQRNHAEEVAALHHRTIYALALAIEAKDQTTHDHLQRVEVYAIEVGKELGMTGSDLDALRASALLHDIGKLAVPEYIISKPGRLTPDEFEKMKIHPVVGAEIIEQIRFPYAAAPIVRSHHEKWDGSGYPDGLAGEDIPLGARVLAAVDCLDALASDRQYRRALPLDEAIKIIEAESGKGFDPRVVEVLARRYVELERMAKSASTEKPVLSKQIKIERGAAPAAGFASTADTTSDLVNFHRSIGASGLEQCTDREAAFELARDRTRSAIPFDAMAIYECQSELLVPVFLDGDNYRLFASLKIPFGMGLSGWVAENRKSILNGNPSVEPGYLNDPTKFSILRSALAVPLENEAGLAGVISLYHQDRDAFTRDHLALLESLSAKLAGVLETKKPVKI